MRLSKTFRLCDGDLQLRVLVFGLLEIVCINSPMASLAKLVLWVVALPSLGVVVGGCDKDET